LSPSESSEIIIAYLESVIAKINRVGQENFPESLLPSGENESVTFSLELTSEGNIHNLSLLKKSRFENINKFAIETLRRASPYPRFDRR